MIEKADGYHSAGRLLRVVSALRDSAMAGNESKSLLELIALANGLSLNNPNVLGLAQAVSELPRKVDREVGRLDESKKQYVAPGVKILVETLSPANLGKPWSAVSRDLEVAGVPALAHYQSFFSGLEPENLVDRGELTRLADEATLLLVDVRMNDSLPLATREFVESSLVHLLAAIEQYWVKGAGTIERSLDATVGRAVREGHFVNPGKASRSVLGRLGGVLIKVALVVGLANDMDTLPKTVQDVVHGIEHVVEENFSSKPADQHGDVVQKRKELPPVDHK
jgi:hypothetical protein